jgi:glycerate 2-kinase
MANLMNLRLAAGQIFEEALGAVDPGAAVNKAIRVEDASLQLGDVVTDSKPVYCVAVGKASFAMGSALKQLLGGVLAGGVLVGHGKTVSDTQESLSRDGWYRIAGGHPLPNKRSLYAAERVFELVHKANNEHGLLIFLVSGGGSAMIEWPISEEITLANMRIANTVLIASGASITEVNAVRRAFSFIKGGRLAAKAPNCDQITLIVSDVPQGEEWNVASGPTLTPPADAPKARDVVERYQLRSRLPEPILRAIDSDDGTPPSDNSTSVRKHFVLLDNNTALEAAATAARKRGLTVKVPRDISDEPIEAGVEKLLTRLNELKAGDGANVCLISGGEFACPVRGDGLGGRNLETALRLAIAADQNSKPVGEFVALCAGTDGIDGNSPAAGAIVDSTTIERAKKIGLDPQDFLSRSDSYSFFVALGDVVTTGPTGTNVRDLRILLTPATIASTV